MSPRLDSRRLAQVRLAGMRSRAILLRRRAIALGVSSFVVAWSLIFIRMVTGHDPVLGAGTANASATKRSSASSAPAHDRSRPSGSAPRMVQQVVRVPLPSGGYGLAVVNVPARQAQSASAAPTQTAPAPQPAPTPAPAPAPLSTSSS
jgi:hypothetical protein